MIAQQQPPVWRVQESQRWNAQRNPPLRAVGRRSAASQRNRGQSPGGSVGAMGDVAQELADLQNRFHLLEGDRKAFYEQSQLTLKHNKEVCDTLRRENKDLRAALSSMHKERGGGAGSDAALLNDAEVAKIETQLTLLRQKQNQLVHGNKAKEKQLTQFEDELRDLGKNGARPAHEANPLMRQIRTLENRLDKAMIKYNEAQSIRKTYDQIVKRLKEERVNFDNQLGAIEATLGAKEHDYEELLLMSHDASHAKDVARAELSRLTVLVQEERKAREKEVTERRNAVQARQEMAERMEEREKMRREIVLASQGDLGEASEQALKQNVVTNALHHQLNAQVVEGEQQVMSAYEAAFRKIKESTGVSDVNEVIQKFLTQEQTQGNLTQLTKEAQARIEQLAEERIATKAMVDEVKYSGGTGHGSRQEVEQWERKHTELASGLERSKTRHARLQKLFIDIRVGIEHMADKLEPVKLDVPPVPVSDETIVDVMLQCDSKLMKLNEAAASLPPEALAEPRPYTAGKDDEGYNVRVTLIDSPDMEDDDTDDGVEPEIPDRTMMKKMHGMMLDKANAKGKKRRKRFVGAEGGEKPPSNLGKGAPRAAAGSGYSATVGTRSMGRRGELE